MLTTFKEFSDDCYRYFKKYSDPEEAHANPSNILVGRAIMDEQGCTSSLKKKGKSINRVELFRETHVRVGTFVLQATEDAHSQPTPEGNQPLSRDEIYDQVLGRRSSYSKGLGWGPKSKAHKTTSSSSSTTSCSQSATEREI
ncbi:CACTA en-spm transposon protein [Cucumis melo var. makuwa]|uniref:CACTA en-spm transposon protein n=1 Tax=Cucumis melo var. makuwa TaxID=1194695 RepID=A0A5D3BCK2_CUCMM|nr:CACTA en-spm transposon protein [Cucumis melo var. makuwa]